MGFEYDEDSEQSYADQLHEFFEQCELLHARGAAMNFPEPFPEVPPFSQTPAGALREDFYQYTYDYLSEGSDYYVKVRAHVYGPDNYRNDAKNGQTTTALASAVDSSWERHRGTNAPVVM